MRIEEGSNRCGGSVTGVELGLRRKMTDGWDPLSVRVSEGRAYRFGKERRWAAGSFSDLGRKGSLRPSFIFLFCFLLFLFLFSYFYFIFCKYASKPLKPLSEISLNSKYQSGTVRNRFLK
jgi:hypothetical protein